jgi:hypothetical protein
MTARRLRPSQPGGGAVRGLKRFIGLGWILVLGCLFAFACSSGSSPGTTPGPDDNTELSVTPETATSGADTATPSTTDAASWPRSTATAPAATTTRTPGIAYPDATLTPGDVRPVAAAQVCKSGYSSSVRSVSTATKNKVYSEYHITSHVTGAFEVDHLISLELGGSNDIKNLWPEPSDPRPGFHEKDQLENKLHALICAGRMELTEAQHEIATDWYAA